jgi:hypothetical protein
MITYTIPSDNSKLYDNLRSEQNLQSKMVIHLGNQEDLQKEDSKIGVDIRLGVLFDQLVRKQNIFLQFFNDFFMDAKY